MILYFTGTGNSLYIAKKLSAALQDELLCINERIKKKDYSPIESHKPLVFVLPTYAWRIPKVVEQWIEQTEFSPNTDAYFVMNCGSDIGNAEKYLLSLCQKKMFSFKGVKEIIMPENYIALYDAPEAAEAKLIINHAEPGIQDCVETILHNSSFQKLTPSAADRIKSSFINHTFYRFVVKADKFNANDKCIGCGKCKAVCPLNNIELKDNKPVWGKKCTHCMACICKCPVEAIEYGKNSAGKPRYQCPL
ncbi:MAG: putative ferredoxin [Lacrimispora sp.]|nr:putative ferredoxin [Lacrimispora sp.]